MNSGNKDQKVITPNFQTIILPKLNGSEKQIAWAKKIRLLYVGIFQRKLAAIPYFKTKDRAEFIEKFEKYVQHPNAASSASWIEHHCSKCGLFMVRVSDGKKYCDGPGCDYSIEISNYGG